MTAKSLAECPDFFLTGEARVERLELEHPDLLQTITDVLQRTGIAPGRLVLEVTETDGLDRTTWAAVRAALTQHPDIDAVYSIGGGNSTYTITRFLSTWL